jgi:hypothetical protein
VRVWVEDVLDRSEAVSVSSDIDFLYADRGSGVEDWVSKRSSNDNNPKDRLLSARFKAKPTPKCPTNMTISSFQVRSF